MRVVVINLEESKDRRASIAAQLDPLHVAYTFFDAIDGPRGMNFFAAYNERRYLANTGRKVSPNEAACFASHRCIWEQCVSSGRPILVLEDDAAVLPDFPAALTKVDALIGRYGFIRVQGDATSRTATRIPVEHASPFTLSYYSRCPLGAMGYAISPAVAATFVDKSRVLAAPVDLFIKKFWVHGRPLFALSPSSIEGSDLSRFSTIKYREKDNPGPALRAARMLNKLESAIGRRRFNLAYHASRQVSRKPGLEVAG